MQKVLAKINLKSIQNNATAFKKLTNGKLCAVVKANAYGHGGVEIANALLGIADFFAVAILEEGIEIQTAVCGKEVLVLTPPTTVEEADGMIEHGFSVTVGDLWTARLVDKIATKRKKSVNVHLKVNTGMNRYGMNVSMLGKVCKYLLKSEYVKVKGVYSHLYGNGARDAERQRVLFLQAKRVSERYFQGLTYHLSATYGTLLGEEFYFDAVRIGIGLYGYLPSGLDEKGKTVSADLHLQKAMQVYAKSVVTRKLSFGGIAYGKKLPKEKKGETATVFRFGYADGFLRRADDGTKGFERNANSLCMDACIRFGRKDRGRYELILSDALQTAEQTDTIPYEVLCSATRRAEFEYVWE